MAITCPTLADHLDSAQCLENLAGLGIDIYVFDKNDLDGAIAWKTGEEAIFATPKFVSGKGLYKFVGKDASQKVEGSSLGPRKGFSQSFTFVIDEVSRAMGITTRALNNLNLGFIIQDGDDYQMIYSPTYRGKFENDGIKTDTGAAASDERNTTCVFKLEPVLYPNTYVEPPTGGFDTLLASAANASDQG